MWFAKSPAPTSGSDLPPNTPTHAVESVPAEINPLVPGAAAQAAPPKVPTGLRLDADQEARLVNRALDRIDEVMDEMGLAAGGAVSVEGWMWERQKNQMQYDNEWTWRAALGGIFAFSNFSLNIAKRYARLMAAKTSDDLIGTDPFFASMPTQHGDPTLAKESEWYLQEEVSRSNAKRSLADGAKCALIRNEATIKSTYVTTDTGFIGPATVAVGPFAIETAGGSMITPPGQPVITPKGQYIYEKDDVIPDPSVQGLMRLQKEPSVAFRHAFAFQYFPDIQQRLIAYEGLDVRVLDYRDFLCPLNAATVHEADINVHLFDVPHAQLVSQYGQFEVSTSYTQQAYVSGEKTAKPEKSEPETTSKVLQIVNCADVYMRAPLEEGGEEVEIWMVIDRVAKKAIWYDYLGNHMGKRPFEVIPGVERVPNRWYGVGVFEMLAHKQLYIDTQFNRVNFKSSKASSVRFRVKNAVAQWKAGEQVVVGDDQILDVEDPRFDAKNPPLYQVNLNEVDEYAMKLIELMIQAGSTEVGIVGPDDGAMSGLDSTKLATGIKSLERTGNVLMKFTEADQGAAISSVLDQCVDIILEHMDDTELWVHPDSQALIQLNREEIRKIKKTTKLLLTRSRSTETIETARMVIQLCREYYEALNPYERFKLRDEYLRQLKALETPDADNLLDEVPKAEADAFLQQQKQPPTIPPKTSIATKYPDLARSEQIQVLKREGIEPASDQEIAKQTAQDNSQEISLEAGKARVNADAKVEAGANGNGSKSAGGGAASKR